MFDSILRHEGAAEVVARARVCSFGVLSRYGPHVTPDLFAVAGGRVWIVTSTSSVKARSIRRRPDVSVLLRDGDRSLVLNGRAEILSIWSAREALRLALYSGPIGVALADFTKRNIGTLLGYVMDLCMLPSGAIPLDRVFVSVRPTGGLLLDGDKVLESWTPQDIVPAAAGEIPWSNARIIDAPAPVADLLAHRTTAAVGWSTSIGPIVLPGTWEPRTKTAHVSEDAFRVVRAPTTSPACITLDDSEARRPTKFRGVILRGMGHFSKGRVHLSVEQAAWWSGFQTGTVLAEVAIPSEQPRAAASS